jgi:hypothetical protein
VTDHIGTLKQTRETWPPRYLVTCTCGWQAEFINADGWEQGHPLDGFTQAFEAHKRAAGGTG